MRGLPSSSPRSLGTTSCPSVSHLCLFPELLPVEPLHLHGGISFLVSGALGQRRGSGGGGAGISEGVTVSGTRGEGLQWTGAPGGRDTPVLPPSPALLWGHYHRLGVLVLTQPQAVQHRAGDTGQPVGEPLPDGSWVNVLHTTGIDDDIHTLGGCKQPSEFSISATATSSPSPASPTWKNSAILATWLAQAHLRASGTSSPTCGSQGVTELRGAAG